MNKNITDMLGFYTLGLAFKASYKNLSVTLIAIISIAIGVGSFVVMDVVYESASGFGISGQVAKNIFAITPRSQTKRDLGEANVSWGLATYDDYRTIANVLSAKSVTAVVDVIAPIGRSGEKPVSLVGAATTRTFFNLFGFQLSQGRLWGTKEEHTGANVVIISSKLQNRFFGGDDPIGKTLLLAGRPFKIIGVYGKWKPIPHFYALENWAYGNDVEDFFVPLLTSRVSDLSVLGNVLCQTSKQKRTGAPNAAECSYLTMWAQCLDPVGCTDGESSLHNYGINPGSYKFTGLERFIAENHVMPPFVLSGLAISITLLLICLGSAGGIFMVKFDDGRRALAIRRALGATKLNLFIQCFSECVIYGLLGDAFGVILAAAAVLFLHQQHVDVLNSVRLSVTGFAAPAMAGFGCVLLVGLYPAWKSCGNLNAEIMGAI